MIQTDSDKEEQKIRQLAFEWAKLELPSQYLAYTDYLTLVRSLHTVTGNVARTAHLVTAVLNQAARLGHSSEWVEWELRFEAKVEAVGDRTACLLADLHRHGASDTALDRYNERIIRFTNYD